MFWFQFQFLTSPSRMPDVLKIPNYKYQIHMKKKNNGKLNLSSSSKEKFYYETFRRSFYKQSIKTVHSCVIFGHSIYLCFRRIFIKQLAQLLILLGKTEIELHDCPNQNFHQVLGQYLNGLNYRKEGNIVDLYIF